MMKMTKKVALEMAISALSACEIKEYHIAGDDTTVFKASEAIKKLTDMIGQLDKKPTGDKGMTENQKQNVGYKDNILATLSDGKLRTATEILHDTAAFPEEMTNQRVSALLRQLILDGKVKKEVVKGKTLFSLVEGV